MDYTEALEKLSRMTRFGINLGLQRIRCLLKLLGNPEEHLPVIHIGGTNGKGSTLAMLSSILRAAGYRVGTFTSPHLVSYTERFMICGQEIAEKELAALLEEVLAQVAAVEQKTGEKPTEFEVLTAVAFLYFAREQVDVALLEVGLGGDIDSTNVVKKPLLAIITNVALDHTAYLGETRAEIARRKCGIIKEGCPVLTGSTEEEVLAVLREQAAACRAPLYEITGDTRWLVQGELTVQGKKTTQGKSRAAGKAPEDKRQAGQYFALHTPHADYHRLFLPLWGQHQPANAALAVRAAELLKEKGWKIEERHIRQGLAETQWAGRLELVGTNPLVVLDGAHNPAGMAALAQWLSQQKEQKKTIQRVILVIGMLDDKNRAEAISRIGSLVDVAIITRPNSDRARTWEQIKLLFDAPSKALVIEDVAKALQKALVEASPQDLVLVTGSLYLIGEVKKLLKEKSLEVK
jgi:dihydrofolate synthase/folylpolyglutamate synthase